MAWDLFKIDGANVHVIVTKYIRSEELHHEDDISAKIFTRIQEVNRWVKEKKESEKEDENEKNC